MGLSGRDLFTFNPELIAEQNDEEDTDGNEVAQYERQPEEGDEARNFLFCIKKLLLKVKNDNKF